MNGMANVGQALSVEVNYAPTLFVGMTIFDDSGVSPVQLGAILPMLNVISALYRAKYTLPYVGTFIFRKAVYTDGTFTALDPNYSESSESVQGVNLYQFLNSDSVQVIVDDVDDVIVEET